MLTQSDPVILARAVLAAGLGFLIGWERGVTGSPIKARTIALAALTAASLTALGHEIFATGTDRVGIALALLVYVVAARGEWPVLSLLRRPTRRTADVPQPTPSKVSR